jgi:hypothetical protein
MELVEYQMTEVDFKKMNTKGLEIERVLGKDFVYQKKLQQENWK